ncbi:uncharacterized protein A4U43_C01F5890 [Asparagus officinalis]|uniref:MCM3-like winged helix domain-containing protein n=2 Tax=Asparagus officinalis TaxID=4686 RepID=A0A5P1FMP7_ASPOF|nr:uncharacterized protein A4U43_C01F5890 [Asparagus officinalis]
MNTEENVGGSTTDAMEVDGGPASDEVDISTERVQEFETMLGQHVVANHLDQISITEIEQLVNRESAVPYTRNQITAILERMQDSNRIMISDGIVRII